jgi:hypothetical protein
MAPLPGASAIFSGQPDLQALATAVAPWCLDGKLPPRPPPRTKPGPAPDRSTDPETDAPEGEQPPGWTEPGTHQQVPSPKPPDDAAPLGPGPGIVLGTTEDDGGEEQR